MRNVIRLSLLAACLWCLPSGALLHAQVFVHYAVNQPPKLTAHAGTDELICPGATATLDGTLLKIWQAGPVAGQGMPGTVLVVDSVGILVACGQGALRLGVLQKPGGKRLAVRDFLAGFTLEAGARFYP